MISWIQNTFKKHMRLVMLLLALAVIIPFVFTIGAMPGIGQGDRKTKTVELFGVPFTSEAERQAFYTDGQISFFLATGQPYFDPTQVQLHAFRRGAALQLADKIGIPRPNQDQLTDFIRTLPAFAGPDRKFDPQAYTRFRDEMTANPQMSQGRISRVLAEDWRVEQVGGALGGPGYAVRGEVQHALARMDTRWTVQTARYDLAKLDAPADPTEEALRAWFDENAIRYRIPERTKVSYIEFPAAAYASRVNLTDEEIVRYFEQNKARYAPPPPKVAEGETPPPPAEAQLADVRDRVVRDLTQARARNLAAKAAADFAYVLFDKKISPGSEAFRNLVEGQKLAVKSPPAFTASEPPPGTGWSSQILTEAFRLGEKRVVSDPLTAGDSTVVLFFEERIPSTDADFFAVRDRVLADVRENRRREAITARGEELRKSLGAAVKSGTTFADAAAKAGLEVKGWENFSMRNLPDDMDYSILGRLEDLAVGTVSPMAVQGERGVFTFVVSREAPEISASDAAFAEAREAVMRQNAQMTEQGLLSTMVEKELQASGLARDSE